MEYPIMFVCLLGVGTVFTGLICIVLLCKIVSVCCKIAENTSNEEKASVANVEASKPQAQIPNRKKIIAAVSAAIAEELGQEVSAIRIKSFKKI